MNTRTHTRVYIVAIPLDALNVKDLMIFKTQEEAEQMIKDYGKVREGNLRIVELKVGLDGYFNYSTL